jgi:beta-mannosidase
MAGTIDHTVSEPHVLAARLWVDEQIVARDVDWPQPLKYLDLSYRGLDIQLHRGDQTRVVINTRKPVKGLVIEAQEGVRISDNAMDIVPGDEQTVIVTGLGNRSLKYRYLGQEVCGVLD